MRGELNPNCGDGFERVDVVVPVSMVKEVTSMTTPISAARPTEGVATEVVVDTVFFTVTV